MPKKVIRVPKAARTLETLRSLGYDFNASVSDLIDNSIAANAVKIDIFLLRQGKNFQLNVVDNGSGMNADKLDNAITFGSEGEYGEQDLGKFGMGLKTASLAHCDSLTILSRPAGRGKHIGRGINTAEIEKENKWITLDYDESESKEILSKHPKYFSKMNTIVQWDIMEIIDQEYNARSEPRHAENYQNNLIRKLRIHVGMVFHRFINSENYTDINHPTIIRINGTPVEAIDPYCTDEHFTYPVNIPSGHLTYIPFEAKIKDKAITMSAYVLPNKDEFSTDEAWAIAKGNHSWNASQGYYIYRNHRLIRFGGWQGTLAKDEHIKYARVSIDIPSTYDKLFKIVVHKAQITFPESLKFHLRKNINPKVTKLAKQRYSKKKLAVVKNKIRTKKKELHKFTKDEVKKAGIQMTYTDPLNPSKGVISVNNRKGSFISNSHSDLIKHAIKESMNITTGILDSDDLWKIISDPNEQKYTVVINQNHPFCDFVYNSKNKVLTSVVDALFYTMGFSELYAKTDANEDLFNTIKQQMSKTLTKLTKEKLY